MRAYKGALALLLALIVLITLSGCGKSDADKYAEAKKLLNAGQYDKAIEAFTELRDYSDSEKYITYIKCLQLGERGEYRDAASALSYLEDFAQARLYAAYYTARALEAEESFESAQEEYSKVLTFRDSMQRRTLLGDRILDRDFGELKLRFTGASLAFGQRGVTDMLEKKYSDSETRMYENFYQLACDVESAHDFDKARYLFGLLAEKQYKDSEKRLRDTDWSEAVYLLESGYLSKAEQMFTALNESGYAGADQKLLEIQFAYGVQKLDGGYYSDAENIFASLAEQGYPGSAEMLNECRYKQALQVEEYYYPYTIDQQTLYEMYKSIKGHEAAQARAAEFEESYALGLQKLDEGEFDDAREIFTALGTYSDSADMISECSYREAAALLEAGEYEQAALAFSGLGAYRDSAAQISECAYRKAAALSEQGLYEDAYDLYYALGEYSDACEILASDPQMQRVAKLRILRIQWAAGERVVFGRTEQDGNTTNGAEPIEWIVLAAQGDTRLVLSADALFAMGYSDSWKQTDWEDSSVNAYLNGEFLSAFSEGERANFADTGIGCLFVLSAEEARTLDAQTLMCGMSAQCLSQAQAAFADAGLEGSGRTVEAAWWLRSEGADAGFEQYVGVDGAISTYGDFNDMEYRCVRPALLVNIFDTEAGE